MIKKEYKMLLYFLIALLVFGVFGFFINRYRLSHSPEIASYIRLQRVNLVDTVDINGVVETKNRREVSSVLNFLVEEVLVSVGDFVQEGQILAVLDTVDLELNILQHKTEITGAAQATLLNLQNAQRAHHDAWSRFNTGQNPQILAAQSVLGNAQSALETARREYDNALTDRNNQNHVSLMNARATIIMARNELENTERTNANNVNLFFARFITAEQLGESFAELDAANERLRAAQDNLINAEANLTRALENATARLEAAQTSYDRAVAAERSARTAAQQELTRLLLDLEAAQAAVSNDASLIALERLELLLEESIIRAPVAGTITGVYAGVGAIGAGLLFVIEDTNDLKITASIRELDAAKVRVGMAAEIRSDATGAEVFYGIVNFIDPTATRSAHGDVEFGAQIDITSENSPLMIGMNTRLSVILQERHDVFAVPFDAVGRDISGHFIFTLDSDAARQVPVEVGLDTDFFVEIFSQELFEGMIILNNAASFTDGAAVRVE
jgi:RND family efflux transporter MFP subunit